MLHFSGKLLLCLAVIVCLSQVAESQVEAKFNWITAMKEDCLKKYHSKKIEVEEEFQDAKYDMTKKSFKLIQKAKKENKNVECIDSAVNAHVEELKYQATTAQSCLDKIGSIIPDSFSSPDQKKLDAMRKRNLIKAGLDECKNVGKSMMKSVVKSFELNGKRCLI